MLQDVSADRQTRCLAATKWCLGAAVSSPALRLLLVFLSYFSINIIYSTEETNGDASSGWF